MKRWIAILTAAVLFLTLLPVTALPARASDYQTPEGYDDYEYQTLVRFLEQTNTYLGGSNGSAAFEERYDPEDPESWNETFSYILWNTDSKPYHVRTISLRYSTGDLDVHGFTQLEDLNLEIHKLSSIDASDCTALKYFDCEDYPYFESAPESVLEYVDLTGCTGLRTVDASDNPELTTLLFSPMPELVCFYCGDCQLSGTLDLSASSELDRLWMENNSFTGLKLNAGSNPTAIGCSNNQLSLLPVPGNSLEVLYCADNRLSSLSVTEHSQLMDLDCSGNRIKSLDLSANNALEAINCRSNQISSLELPADDTKKVELNCGDNALTKLTIPSNMKLKSLTCDKNPDLTQPVQIPRPTYLKHLDIKDLAWGSLDLSPYTKLEYLDCDRCGLKKLDVTGNPNLEYLSFYDNQISAVDLSKNPRLVELYSSKNRLTKLDLSNNPRLVNLGCSNNAVKSLNLAKQEYIPLNSLRADGGGTVGIVLSKRVWDWDDGETDDPDYVWHEIWTGDWDAVYKVFAKAEEGYTFQGWYDENSKKVSSSTTYAVPELDSHTELTARFKAVVGIPEVSASNVAATGKIKLSWKAVTNAARYEIWRASSKAGTYKLLKTTESLSFTNTSPKAGETWYYKVRALKADGKAGPFCEPVTRTCDLPQPAVKGGHNAETGKNKLTWTAVEGAKEYKVYRSGSKSSGYKLMKTTTDLSYTNTGAKAGETWYYKVMAVHSKSAANSAYSEIKTITCDLPRPVVTIALSSGKPKLSWKAIEGAKAYKVYRSESKSSGYKLMKTTTNLSYTNTGAEKGKTYYYKVKAVHTKSAANSAYSLVKSIKATK